MRREGKALVLALALVLLTPAAALADDPLTSGQSETAEATFQGGTVVAVPAGAAEAAQEQGGGPTVRYVQVPVYGPCINDQGEASNLGGIEAHPPGKLVWTFCIGDQGNPQAPVVDFDQLQRTAVSLVARVRPAPPSLDIQPRGRALVHQPAVFSVADPGAPPSATETSGPFTIVLTLGRPSYEWDFGSGFEPGTRGRPYAGGDVPAEGRGAPYVSHTWRRSGSYPVAVRAVYPASYRVTGPGIDETFELQAVRSTSRVTVQVVQARTQLVRE